MSTTWAQSYWHDWQIRQTEVAIERALTATYNYWYHPTFTPTSTFTITPFSTPDYDATVQMLMLVGQTETASGWTDTTPTVTYTLTPSYTPSSTRTPLPTQGTYAHTPNCYPSGRWVTVWENNQQIGCPVNNPHNLVGAYQEFERGQMIWRGDTGQIIVLYSDGTYSIYPDLWTGGSLPCEVASMRNGFGYLWCTDSDVSFGLGDATTFEQYAFNLMVQDFELGVIFQADQTGNIILYSNSTWKIF